LPKDEEKESVENGEKTETLQPAKPGLTICGQIGKRPATLRGPADDETDDANQ
jgi:hypothetical protein